VNSPDLIAAVMPVLRALDQLGVPYYVGGSVASSLYGVGRLTLDADVIARMGENQVEAFVGRLGAAYYADEDTAREAVRTSSSFNVIHLDTMFKIDVFIGGDAPFDREVLHRRRLDTISLTDDSAQIYVASPEDVVLSKLLWYRSGGEVSERQWRDILGVLKIQGQALDREYMCRWADELQIADMLSEAFRDVGIDL
jgi:hypothetical protein